MDALTDPSTLTEITIGMAEQMDDMIRADWHDGWEEQNVDSSGSRRAARHAGQSARAH